MTLPGGFGMGAQWPNVQRIVVAAWALTWSFVGLTGLVFVGPQWFGSFVGSVPWLSSLRRRHLSSFECRHELGYFG